MRLLKLAGKSAGEFLSNASTTDLALQLNCLTVPGAALKLDEMWPGRLLRTAGFGAIKVISNRWGWHAGLRYKSPLHTASCSACVHRLHGLHRLLARIPVCRHIPCAVHAECAHCQHLTSTDKSSPLCACSVACSGTEKPARLQHQPSGIYFSVVEPDLQSGSAVAHVIDVVPPATVLNKVASSTADMQGAWQYR